MVDESLRHPDTARRQRRELRCELGGSARKRRCVDDF